MALAIFPHMRVPSHLIPVNEKSILYVMPSHVTSTGMYTSSAIYLQDRIFYNGVWIGPVDYVKQFTCSTDDLHTLCGSLKKMPEFTGKATKEGEWVTIREKILKHLSGTKLEVTMNTNIWNNVVTSKILRNIRMGGRTSVSWGNIMDECLQNEMDNEFLVLVYIIHELYGKRVLMAGLLGCLQIRSLSLHKLASVGNLAKEQILYDSLCKLATIIDLVLFDRLQYRGIVEKLLSRQELLFGNPILLQNFLESDVK